MTAGPGDSSLGPAVVTGAADGRQSWCEPCAVTGVTAHGFDLAGHLDVIFWMSARQGGTDTTAKLFGAAAKWLVPRADSPHEVQVLDLPTREGTSEELSPPRR
ncbi:hypothetical protein GCM10010488_12580 [Oerskovia jenensis]